MGQRKQGRKYLFKKKWFRWWMLPVGASILVWVLFHTVFLAGYIPTESMEPTLKKGSFLIAPRVYSGLERGDVIVFWREGELLVKRIAAVGGDIVDLDKLSYTMGWAVPKRKQQVVVVPENSYFVLGDNTDHSFDSRYWKELYVREADVVAKVWESNTPQQSCGVLTRAHSPNAHMCALGSLRTRE